MRNLCHLCRSAMPLGQSKNLCDRNNFCYFCYFCETQICAICAICVTIVTQYRIKYVQDWDAEAKEKMYKHAFLAGVGIACLFMIGIAGLIDSQKNDNRIMSCSW